MSAALRVVPDDVHQKATLYQKPAAEDKTIEMFISLCYTHAIIFTWAEMQNTIDFFFYGTINFEYNPESLPAPFAGL